MHNIIFKLLIEVTTARNLFYKKIRLYPTGLENNVIVFTYIRGIVHFSE